MQFSQDPIFLAFPYKSYLLVWEETDKRLCWTDHPGEACDTIAEATNNLDGSVRVIFDTVHTMNRVADEVFQLQQSVSNRNKEDIGKYRRDVVRSASYPWVPEFKVLELLAESIYGITTPSDARVNDLIELIKTEKKIDITKLVPIERRTGTTHQKVQTLVEQLFKEGAINPGFPEDKSDANKMIDELAESIVNQKWLEQMMSAQIEKAWVNAKNLEIGEYCMDAWDYVCLLHPKTRNNKGHITNALVIELGENGWHQAEPSRWCPESGRSVSSLNPVTGVIKPIKVKDVYHDSELTAFDLDLSKLPDKLNVGDQLHLLPNKPLDPKTLNKRHIHQTISTRRKH